MAFLQSDNKMYNILQREGKCLELFKKDYVSKLSMVQALGYAWDAVDQQLVRPQQRYMSAGTPWVHQRPSPHKHCALDHHIMFNVFGIIPPRCLECWKTVVSPRTFHELMLLEELQIKMDKASKCGIELRDYTPKHYGGYFYNCSLDDGRKTYKEVRDAVDEMISPEVSVILKRGCTEYEFLKGPSPYWHMTEKEEKMVQEIEAFVNVPRSNAPQPDLVKNHVKGTWFIWAHSNGDFTYMDYNGGKKLWPDYVKYHEGNLDDIKRDLAVARGVVKGELDEKIVDEFLVGTSEYAKEAGIDMGKLANALGANETNPLRSFTINEIPEEAKGDLDELT